MILKQVIPMILTNSQSSATPAPFQHMFTYPVASNSLINADCSNVRFHDINGNVITSWLESTSGTWWLSLVNGIDANSEVIIYMHIYDSSNFMFDGLSVGEAPQLSATYGQYDNGASVFPFYDNFAGTTLSSKWTVPSSSIYKVNNGFIAEPSAGSTTAVYAASVQETSSIITEWLLNFDGVTFPQSFSYWQLNRYTAGSNMHFLGSSGNDSFRNNNVGIASVSVPSSGLQIYGVWNDRTIVRWFYPDGNYTDTTAASITDYVSLGWSVNSTTTNFPTIYWVRTRAYPPNGIMPSAIITGHVLFGYAPIYIGG